MQRLRVSEWTARQAAHQARVRPWAEDRVQRMRCGQKHPVYDFLFEYYAYRPAYLLRWSPGFDVILEGCSPTDCDWPAWAVPTLDGSYYSINRFPDHRRDYLDWAISYLQLTSEREPFFGCFGLHEWAMVYREAEVRHRQIPLRLSRAETDQLVESHVLCCSHYDAFRFFTPAARPRNRQQLCREDSRWNDQPACLHVNMDLYKFGFVLAPLIPAELIADAFELAVQVREVDMRASPYDLRAEGFEPIPIETREGREEYVHWQRRFFSQGQPIRRKLLAHYQALRDRLASRPTPVG